MVIIIALIAFQSIFILQRCNKKEEVSAIAEEEVFNPVVAKALLDEQYAGTESCIECHEKEYYEWLGSHHDESMMVASDSSIKGDFNNVIFYNCS